jgi:hypothetical protein
MHPVLGLKYGHFSKFSLLRRLIFLAASMGLACLAAIIADGSTELSVTDSLKVAAILFIPEFMCGYMLKTIMPTGPRGE